MSLRLKILILVAGAIIVPAFVAIVSVKFDADLARGLQHHKLFLQHREWIGELTDGPIDPDDIDSYLERAVSAVEVRVFDSDGSLISANPAAPALADLRPYHITETVRVEFTNGDTGYFVILRPANPYMRNTDLWYVPLTGLLFVAAMVIVIAYSVNRSVSRLERATRRIAEGDLDFELPIKGRDKLASLTRSFDSMREHLREEYARRSRFIMGISHDLKTPLSSISGYANAIGEGFADTPEKLEKYIGIIEDKTRLLESRISMLIDFVKQDTSEWKIALRPIELKPFFEEMAAVFESEAALNDRKFSQSIQIGAGIAVSMDEGMIVRAFENLMHNAMIHSREHDSIEFRCTHRSTNPDEVVVEFMNTGPGIDPDVLHHIFDPFVRGERSRKGPGMGLGLSTVELVFSSHGWSIGVTSKPGDITVFTIAIPVV